MIKRILCLILCFLMISVSAFAEDEVPMVPIELDTGIEVYSVYASYAVGDEGIEAVSVVFNDDIKSYAYSNFVNGRVWISIASANPISFDEPLCYVSAVSADGNSVSPKMELSSLSINGKKISSEKFVVQEFVAEKSNKGVTASITICDELMRNAKVFVVAYGSNDSVVGIRTKTLTATEATKTLTFELESEIEAEYVRAFFWKENMTPVINSIQYNLK